MIGIGRNAIAALACALLGLAAIAVQAQHPISENDKYNPARYPDWSGPMRFTATGGNRYDQTKRPGRAQQAPLTPNIRRSSTPASRTRRLAARAATRPI